MTRVFPSRGKHSVGVARQYCGQVGKQDNCQVAVSLSVSTWNASLPIAWRLYLPEVWCQDAKRCQQAGVPEGVEFQTKPEIALRADSASFAAAGSCGSGTGRCRLWAQHAVPHRLTELGLQYIGGIETPPLCGNRGNNPCRPRRESRAVEPPPTRCSATPIISRFGEAAGSRLAVFGLEGHRLAPGSQGTLRSRFAAVRVRPAHRDEKRTEPRPEEWLLIEWPKEASEPTKYWLSNLPVTTSLKSLVKLAKHRWVIERDYEELKQELGLGHYEGRSWRGFHHHATLCIAAYGFLMAERNRFSPSARAGHVGLSAPPSRRRTSAREGRRVRPERHNPHSIATLRIVIARYLLGCLPHCPFCGSRSD